MFFLCVAYLSQTYILIQQGSIYEHNVRTFDISNPVDALNVATFITFIATEHTQKLRELLSEQKLRELAGKLDRDDPSLHWTMEHQFPSVKKTRVSS